MKSSVALVAAAALSALAAPALADFPREGNPDIPNGVAGPFAGGWQVGFPEGEGMINGAPVVACDAPVELKAGSDDGYLVYVSPKGQEVAFELTAFAGRTTWMPQFGESTIAVWIDADSFYAYTVDLATGRARWDDPRVYRRCEG